MSGEACHAHNSFGRDTFWVITEFFAKTLDDHVDVVRQDVAHVQWWVGLLPGIAQNELLNVRNLAIAGHGRCGSSG